MKKLNTMISFAVATALFTGCGLNDTTDNTVTSDGTTVTVERGPVLGAKVVDAAKQVATEVGNGKYKFANLPTYPIVAIGGIIDIDRDGVLSLGDVINDLNLTTLKGEVLSIATTLATNPSTKTFLDKIVADLNISIDTIYTQTPTSSKEIEAISNAVYKLTNENNISSLTDVNASTLTDLNISKEVQTKYEVYVNDDTHDSVENERVLVEELSKYQYVDTLDANEIEYYTSKVEEKLDDDEIEDIYHDLLELKYEYENEHGDMEYDYDGHLEVHNQGVSCASCHSTNNITRSLSDAYDDERDDDDNEEENENQFDSGVTIFTTLDAINSDATKAAYDYKLRLVLEGGEIVNYHEAEGTGNLYANFNAGIDKFTVEVLNPQGIVVNSSKTNSHDASRFDCNSCHSVSGNNGTLGRVVSFTTTPPVIIGDTNTTTAGDTNTTTTISFQSNVLPILDTNCKSCHGDSGNFSITASATSYDGMSSFVDTTNPTASPLLQKLSGEVTHDGGVIFSATTQEYIAIRDWITQGALNN